MSQSLENLPVSRDGYTFPADEILTGRGFITGKSGSGKSNTANVIVEELLDRGLGLLIVDTDGEYRGLKEEYDVVHVGKGDECDMTVTPSESAEFARDALSNNLAVLLDVSTYHDEQATYDVIHEIVNAFFIAEHDLRVPYLLLLEEAHEFIPQKGGGDSDLESLIIRVAKRGRKRGLGICCLSQRPASVDKDYITQCDWFVWHRLTWENDTEVVGRIMGSEAAKTVQTLDNGEAIVMTDWDESTNRVQFRLQRTPDIGATPSLDDMDLGSNNQEQQKTAEDVKEKKRTIGDMVKTPFGVGKDSGDDDDSGGSPVSDGAVGAATGTDAGERAAETDEAEEAAAVAESAATAETAEPAETDGETATEESDTATADAASEEDDENEWRYRTESINQGSNSSQSAGTDPLGSNEPKREIRRTPATYTFTRSKPSLQSRREKRETPTKSADPIWEIGAMMVYLYDSFVWYHLYVVYRMEMAIAKLADRLDDLLWGGRRPRQPGRIEQASYRVGAYLGLAGIYAILVVGLLFLI